MKHIYGFDPLFHGCILALFYGGGTTHFQAPLDWYVNPTGFNNYNCKTEKAYWLYQMHTISREQEQVLIAHGNLDAHL